MTRLLESDIDMIEIQLQEYEKLFVRQTGHTMEEIARRAVGITKHVKKRKAAVIPVTSGFGLIGGFSQAVESILRHCQTETMITDKTDVGGLQQAYLSDCQLAFLADDEICAAFGIGSTVHSDNGFATGRGYASAMIEAMKNRGINPRGECVLILGAGPVGKAAAQYISEQQAVPVICDLDSERSASLAAGLKNSVCIPAPAPLRNYTYIIDATTAAGFITAENVTEETIIAAPGMPCGAAVEVREKATVIHNPLELGIITMYFDCMKQLEE